MTLASLFGNKSQPTETATTTKTSGTNAANVGIPPMPSYTTFGIQPVINSNDPGSVSAYKNWLWARWFYEIVRMMLWFGVVVSVRIALGEVLAMFG